MVFIIFSVLEFIRIGYYVSNDYTEPELREVNPSPPLWDKLQRNILATNPRSITRKHNICFTQFF